jgi:hypothetical protein
MPAPIAHATPAAVFASSPARLGASTTRWSSLLRFDPSCAPTLMTRPSASYARLPGGPVPCHTGRARRCPPTYWPG